MPPSRESTKKVIICPQGALFVVDRDPLSRAMSEERGKVAIY